MLAWRKIVTHEMAYLGFIVANGNPYTAAYIDIQYILMTKPLSLIRPPEQLPESMQEFYVDSPRQLLELCEHLRGSPWIAVDTEFMREKTYYAQLCLLQVANENVLACVDPLALDDLGPLLDIIYDPATVKVMHAARQDLEIFYGLRQEVPRPLFDTQIAATLLGYGEQVGYGALVRGMFDIELDKSHTRTDWSRRPLYPEQLRYAADDVRHLRHIYCQQLHDLASKKRLGWLNEDFADLTDIRRYKNPPLELWRRVRQVNTLKGVQLAALRALVAWREERAKAMNRPRKWILGDDVLLDMARHLPVKPEQLRKIRGLDVERLEFTTDILDLIHDSKSLPKAQWPQLEPPLRLEARQEALVDALMAVVRLGGAQNSVSPTTLATRKELEQLVMGDFDAPILHGWRGALVGEDIRALLQGKRGLRVRDGELCVHSA